MAHTRRMFLATSLGAGVALTACGQGEPAPAVPASAQSSWIMPPEAQSFPGYALWRDAKAGAVAPIDAPLLTADGPTNLRTLLAGRPAVLSFWAPWCAPCLAEKPALDALAGDLAAAGGAVAVFSILAFTNDGPPTLETAQQYHRRFNLTHLQPVADASGDDSPFKSYVSGPSPIPGIPGMSVLSIPCATLIDPSGFELRRVVGASSRVSPPAGLSKSQIESATQEQVATWPKVELWREPEMLRFLRAVGGA